MQPIKRIVIIAGEESGDLHAAHFIHQLKANDPTLEITGIGGRHMQAAGVHLVSDIARFAVTGVSEVVRNIQLLYKTFKDIKIHLATQKPDLLILVDFPGFNLRLAKFVKKSLHIKTIYYISPQIWAWKASRIKLIRECVDKMAVILPFEKKIYEDAQVPVAFVGHPLVEKVSQHKNTNDMRLKLGLPLNKRIVALLPGSRMNEIKQHMPVLNKTAIKLCKQMDDIHFVIPVAGTIDPLLISSYFTDPSVPFTLIQGQAVETASCSDCAVVASGTASLECALLCIPMCIIYKVSHLTYMAAFTLMKVRYIGLCNLLQNEMIVPELLQYDCNPEELSRVVHTLLNDSSVYLRMKRRLEALKLSLSAQKADCSIAALIESEMQ